MPFQRTPWLLQIAISILGIIDSSYLTWIKLTHNESSCIQGVGNCYSVNTSPYSAYKGIPIAVFGIIGYLAILIVLILQERSAFWKNASPMAVFGISLFGVLYSAYLTYLEIAVIQAICPFCVMSAGLMLALFLLSVFRLAKSSSPT